MQGDSADQGVRWAQNVCKGAVGSIPRTQASQAKPYKNEQGTLKTRIGTSLFCVQHTKPRSSTSKPTTQTLHPESPIASIVVLFWGLPCIILNIKLVKPKKETTIATTMETILYRQNPTHEGQLSPKKLGCLSSRAEGHPATLENLLMIGKALGLGV